MKKVGHVIGAIGLILIAVLICCAFRGKAFYEKEGFAKRINEERAGLISRLVEVRHIPMGTDVGADYSKRDAIIQDMQTELAKQKRYAWVWTIRWVREDGGVEAPDPVTFLFF